MPVDFGRISSHLTDRPIRCAALGYSPEALLLPLVTCGFIGFSPLLILPAFPAVTPAKRSLPSTPASLRLATAFTALPTVSLRERLFLTTAFRRLPITSPATAAILGIFQKLIIADLIRQRQQKGACLREVRCAVRSDHNEVMAATTRHHRQSHIEWIAVNPDVSRPKN